MTGTSAVKYFLGESGEYVIEGYNSANPFSSFFPGIAGVHGIPMWTFYVNRGQCLCSMGIQDKDHSMMEFLSANRAYQLTSTQGFRTFVKIIGDKEVVYEPFQNTQMNPGMDCSQRMIIRPSSLSLEEENHTLGLLFRVDYNNVPNEDYAGLVRRLTVRNLRDEAVKIEVLDGLPLIIPFGVDNLNLKYMRRLVEAFVEVVNLEHDVPYFRSKVKQEDRPEVLRVEQGNFYFGFVTGGDAVEQVQPIVDPQKVFGSFQDFRFPDRFVNATPYAVDGDQILENILPCAMGCFSRTLDVDEEVIYSSVVGHADSLAHVSSIAERGISDSYLAEKQAQNEQLIDEITQMNFVCSADKRFDYYCRYNFMDNALRGGLPVTLKGRNNDVPMYVYSRKHGDLERDYNEFCLLPSYYSQGNGNFRDVNQNRRSDLFINPDLKDHNVKHFFNLIQLDGFNPLVVKPTTFSLGNADTVRGVLEKELSGEQTAEVLVVLQGDFTPGDLMKVCRFDGQVDDAVASSLVADVLSLCDACEETDHSHGYWSDHWLYNLDLLINYMAVYPESSRDVIFARKEYTFHDSAYRVAPRDDKYVLWDGNPMQLLAVVKDEAKETMIASRSFAADQMRTEGGQGEIYKTSLFVKMFSLITNKLASLDAFGVGIEMESDKPNWYDALNGLPGQHGSSLNETLEVKRIIDFALDAINEHCCDHDVVAIPAEIVEFYESLQVVLCEKYIDQENISDFAIWDRMTTAKEAYRAKTFFGIEGTEKDLSVSAIKAFFELAVKRLDEAIAKAWSQKDDLPYSYFLNKVVAYELIEGKVNARGQQCYRVKKFEQQALPLFLESPVHYLKAEKDLEKARTLAKRVRTSGLYDEELKMYKVNESLAGQPMEIGRTRIFTPGWFENESVWLHMEYKYMLELLRNGLHSEFFADFKNVLVPFFDPAVYGRSILENSSFIASSANKNTALHGGGFVARLSGATAEFIHILQLMTSGEKPYTLNADGALELSFRPVIPAWLFSNEAQTRSLYVDGQRQEVTFDENTFSFMFMGQTQVTYKNAARKDTFGADCAVPARMTVYDREQGQKEFSGSVLNGEVAERVRDRKIEKIEIELV